MRDELTCWDSLRHRGFTGQEAALAMVGEPETDDPAKLRKAMHALEMMRARYEGTRRWFANAPEDGEAAPRGLLASVEMKAAQVVNEPYRTPRLMQLWPQPEPLTGAQAKNWEHNFRDWRFLNWLRTPMADFDRQTFARDVLARWVQEVGASALYPFTDAEPHATTATVPASTPTSTDNKVWTDKRIAEAQAFRDKHGLKKTAELYLVSQATITKHTRPKKKQEASPFSGLGTRAK
ncbi:MAG: hypothetical protein Q8K38_07800 [Burkholderiaceae bacterium]|nr:hypothetical protein [Burkholderiaceae bacterium]MDZ4144727.1 hypothetical protein [Burkholderiales bacterium]